MVEVKCDHCGKTIERTPSLIKRSKHHFCSNKCGGEWYSKFLSDENSPNWNGGKIEVKCDNCGETTKKYPSYIKKHKYHFCSRQCLIKYQLKQVDFKCEWCGKITKTYIFKTKVDNYPFCSHNCQYEHNIKQVEAKCGWCGKITKQPLSQITNYKHHFCNRQCYNKFNKGKNSSQWRGGVSFEPYGVKFNNDLKEQIRKRDNFTCQECGNESNGRKLDVHHIDYNKKNNVPSNLIALCSPCNVKANGNRDYWTIHFQEKAILKY